MMSKGCTFSTSETHSIQVPLPFSVWWARIPTWRIIPVCKWMITMVSTSPKWGCSPSKWPPFDDPPSIGIRKNILKFPPPIPNFESWLIAAICGNGKAEIVTEPCRWESWAKVAVGDPSGKKVNLKIYAMVKIEWCNYCIFVCNVFAVLNVHAYIYIYTHIYIPTSWCFQRIWKKY